MSDALLVIIISAVSTIVTSITGIVMLFVKARMDRNERIWAATSKHVVEVTEAIKAQGENIQKIEEQGNSIQTEMVQLTKKSALEAGRKQGIADEKAEQALIALAREESRVHGETAATSPTTPAVVPVAIVSLPNEAKAP